MLGSHTARKLARRIVQGNTPAQVRRPLTVDIHHLTVTQVDVFSGTVGVQFPDPSGNGTEVSAARVVQPYTTDHPPLAGDIAVVHQYGTELYVMGQHVVPVNFITPA
jgi:hypothetical protein